MIGIKMAYYRKADWPRLLSIISDKESMHETWKEWHKAYEKLKDYIKFIHRENEQNSERIIKVIKKDVEKFYNLFDIHSVYE